MKKRIFGFDLGIASIGWAIVEMEDERKNPSDGFLTEGKIVKSGVRIFNVAENPKNGESLAKPRRDKRLSRRLCRRKARRKEAIRNLLIAKGLIGKEDIDRVFMQQVGGDVWDLRVKGLSKKLEKEELARVIFHLGKHRGFKSYRKAEEENDEENGKVLKAIKENREALGKDETKTLAQVIVERAKNSEDKHKRNYQKIIDKNGKKTTELVYLNSIPRSEIKRELKLIYENQKQYGFFTEDLYVALAGKGKEPKDDDNSENGIMFRHRPVGAIDEMVGYCRFETKEKRAPKEAPSSELFVALSKINNMSVYEDNEKRFLNNDERSLLLDLLKKTKTVKYSTISSKIFKEKNIKFADINYRKTVKKDKDGKETKVNPEDEKFYSMSGWHKLKTALGDAFDKYQENIHLLDKIVEITAMYKNDELIQKKFEELNIDKKDAELFKELTFKQFINLSLKALYKIVPYMEQGDKYNEACEKAGYDFRDSGEKLVANKGSVLEVIKPEMMTTVPVVNRAVAQFRKVYNAMVRRYGEPDQINLEVGRELKKSWDERKKTEKMQKENALKREQAKKEIEENEAEATSKNILKYRLYQQQDGKCIYSGKVIDINRLYEDGYAEIDHIIPYSRSLDNSQNNKVLCLSEENRMKGNKTPYEYMKDSGRWHDFKVMVGSLYGIGKRKKDNLLNEGFKNREEEFRERNANDNSHIARYVKQYLNDGISFENSSYKNIKNRIQSRSGSLTDYLRHQWGLEKVRSAGDKHHAQDAIVIACATQGMVQYLSGMAGIFENKYALRGENGEAWYNAIKSNVQEPWKGFRNDVEESLSKVFVSRAVRKNASGEIHEETIRTLNPKHKNYNESDVKSGMHIRGGLANNGVMLRTDVFSKKNKKGKNEFYLVPIYLGDMANDELPNKAIIAGKNEEEWMKIDETCTFLFSLYKNDLIRIRKKEVDIFGYFGGTDRSLGRIIIQEHDRSKDEIRACVKTQDIFKKYQVDPLGFYTEVKTEKRMPLKIKKKTKKCRGE